MNAHRLILVKHSLPEIVPAVPASQWHLSDEGRTRCRSLAKMLALYEPKAIVSSVEPKACETAQIVAGKLGKMIEIADGLHEHERSKVPFGSTDEFETSVRELFAHPSALVFGGETADAAHERFSSAMAQALTKYSGKDIVVVAHGTVISLYVSRVAGLDPFALWKRLRLPSFIVLTLPRLAVETIVEEINC